MSERTQTVDMKCAQLLVVPPDHGRVIYQWEKKIMLDWVPGVFQMTLVYYMQGTKGCIQMPSFWRSVQF